MLTFSKVIVTDGVRFILREAEECEGCHTMHYFFLRTIDGYRCPSCSEKVWYPGKVVKK
jgi:hypothetical protein